MSKAQVFEWCQNHPQIVALAATAVLLQVAYAWHDIITWAEGQVQIEASEFYGG